MHNKTKKTEGNNIIFIFCISIYLLIGFVNRFTSWFKGDLTWYKYLMNIPIILIGIFCQIYPAVYIQNKLEKWGMYEDKANEIAVIVWLILLFTWYFLFMFEY